jgi:hypothetical protein
MHWKPDFLDYKMTSDRRQTRLTLTTIDVYETEYSIFGKVQEGMTGTQVAKLVRELQRSYGEILRLPDVTTREEAYVKMLEKWHPKFLVGYEYHDGYSTMARSANRGLYKVNYASTSERGMDSEGPEIKSKRRLGNRRPLEEINQPSIPPPVAQEEFHDSSGSEEEDREDSFVTPVPTRLPSTSTTCSTPAGEESASTSTTRSTPAGEESASERGWCDFPGCRGLRQMTAREKSAFDEVYDRYTDREALMELCRNQCKKTVLFYHYVSRWLLCLDLQTCGANSSRDFGFWSLTSST